MAPRAALSLTTLAGTSAPEFCADRFLVGKRKRPVEVAPSTGQCTNSIADPQAREKVSFMHESRDAARPLSTDFSLLAPVVGYVLQRQLGMIPDPVEPWFTVVALAEMAAIEEATLRKKVRWSAIPTHPLGKFYRLSDVRRWLDGNPEEAAER